MTRSAAAALLVAILAVGGCAHTNSNRVTYKSVPDVEAVLSQWVPPGTARADVEEALKSRNEDWHYTRYPKKNEDSDLSKIVPDLSVYSGEMLLLMPGRCSFIVLQDFQVYLLFDANDRLAKQVVIQVLTGP